MTRFPLTVLHMAPVAALMNPGALLIVVGVFVLCFGGYRFNDRNLRLPRRAVDWVPYLCAAGIVILLGWWIFEWH